MTVQEATDELKKINRGLFVDVSEGHYVIRYKDDRNTLTRDVRHVLDPEGKPMELKLEDVREFCSSIDWKNVEKFKEPTEMANEFEKELNAAKLQEKLERQGFLLDMRRERAKQWSHAAAEFRDSFSHAEVRAMKKAHEKEQYKKEQLRKLGFKIA